MNTIALIVSYLVLTIATFLSGQTELGGVLISGLGVVITGEYYSIKKTDKTISKNFSKLMPRVKIILSTLFGLFSASLIWHLMTP